MKLYSLALLLLTLPALVSILGRGKAAAHEAGAPAASLAVSVNDTVPSQPSPAAFIASTSNR